LEAWNCGCAAFAFEGVFPGGLGPFVWADLEDNDSDSDSDFVEMLGERGEREVKWEFGGVSFDGRGDEAKCQFVNIFCLSTGREVGGCVGGLCQGEVLGREEMAGVGPKGEVLLLGIK